MLSAATGLATSAPLRFGSSCSSAAPRAAPRARRSGRPYRRCCRGWQGSPPAAPPSTPLQLVPAVTELVISELLWLNYSAPDKPVYVYLNSTGEGGS